GCHSVLSENMLPLFHVCVASGTMCRRLCGCRMEGEEWRERSGGKCVSAAVKGRAGRLVAEGIAHPAQHRPAGHPLSLRSILVDATSTQRGSGCHHHRECDRKGTLQLSRFEGAIRVAQRRAHNPLADSAHKTPGTGRGVFASWRTPRWSPSSFQVDGRLSFFFFPPRRVAAR
ncbi:hypothetical protein TcG_11873, partial [Trypanosoma cruzi]